MRGRKPKPTAVKKRAGNPGKRKLNPHEARIPASLPSCPPHLCREAKAQWKILAPLLYKHGLLTEAERGPLAALCQAYGIWVKAEHQVAKRGMISLTAHGTETISPYFRIARSAREEYFKQASEFGLTPSSRSRVTAVEVEQLSLVDQLFREIKK